MEMADSQTPKQSASFSTPEAPKRASIPRLDHHHHRGPASVSTPSPSTQETIHDHSDLKSLLDASGPDLQPPFTYLGPPIGFSAKIIEHRTPLGVTTTSVYGSLMALRPRLFIQCGGGGDHLCLTCRPVLSRNYPSAGPGAGTGSTTPTPQSFRPREVCPPAQLAKVGYAEDLARAGDGARLKGCASVCRGCLSMGTAGSGR